MPISPENSPFKYCVRFKQKVHIILKRATTGFYDINQQSSIITEQVALNKSSLLLKMPKQNTQTLQLFSNTIKTFNIQ
jgi:hypothetical protein